MIKDFQSWMFVKAILERFEQRPIYSDGEIWNVCLGENIGSEQGGTGAVFIRPVLVVKRFNQNMFWAIPISRKQTISAFEFKFILKGCESVGKLSQLRTLDSKRLIEKISDMRVPDFIAVKEKLRTLLS